MLTEAPNFVSAAREVLTWGPTAVIAKQGKYGAALFTEDGYFALPGLPARGRRGPDRRGRQLRRRLRRLRRRAPRPPARPRPARRARWSTAPRSRSFNVEAFGTDRVEALQAPEIITRVAGAAAHDDVRAPADRAARLTPARPARAISSQHGPAGVASRDRERMDVRVPDGGAEDPDRAPAVPRVVGRAPGAGRRARDAGRRWGVAPAPASARAAPAQPAPRSARRRGARAAGRAPARSRPARAACSATDHGARARGRLPPMSVTSVLSDGTIRRLVDEGRIVIRPWDPGMVQPASVDLRLGDSFRVFHNHRIAAIDLAAPPSELTEGVEVLRRRVVRHPSRRVRARAHARSTWRSRTTSSPGSRARARSGASG